MTQALWRDAALVDRFAALDAWLTRHQHWWRPRAFIQSHLPWRDEQPELAAHLRALSPEQVARLTGDAAALAETLQPFMAFAGDGMNLCEIPMSPSLRTGPSAEPYGVPGRKWRQTVELLQRLPDSGLPVLEWCSGKAHLGRALAREQGRPVEALEWNAALVEEGNRLARRERLPVCVFQVDVLSDDALAYVRPEQEVVALHACGELHLQLLRACAGLRPRALALAPCCYHLNAQPHYRPLSAIAQSSGLTLSNDDLRTAVQESVTSPQRVREQRRRLQGWRLGFDALQREWRGVDEYLPTPPLPPSVLREGFAAFCARLAQHAGIAVPGRVDYAAAERLGAARQREVAALDLVRLLFRRPLEVWLVLDRALYLRESGYAVAVSRFCERDLTPRNLLIHARRTV